MNYASIPQDLVPMKVCKQREKHYSSLKMNIELVSCVNDLHMQIHHLRMYCVYLKSPYRAACTSHSRTGWWSTTGAPCSQTDFTSTCQCFGCFSKYLFLYAEFISEIKLTQLHWPSKCPEATCAWKQALRGVNTAQCDQWELRVACPGAFELRRACKQVFDCSTRCVRVIVFVCQYIIL